MKRLILLPAFLVVVLGLSSCQDHEKELRTTPGCRIAQSNQVIFSYSSNGNRLQAVTYPEGGYVFAYATNGTLTAIQDTRSSEVFPVETDANGNIIEALGYTFQYDNQNRLTQYEKTTGDITSYHRFEYSNGDLTKVYIKALSMIPYGAPPTVKEVLSQSNFLYDASKTPWQGDKVLQWLVATALLAPFEIADQASAYSQHNATGYAIYYAEDQSRPRFTSSVAYTYSTSNVPVTYEATGSAGAYRCSFDYLCGNSNSGDH